ncbi:MAG: phosphoserine transaminase [Hyphomonadaceae bacterium]|nr:phosphoserine transaminase [Hyphomonadaceae bacterium]
MTLTKPATRPADPRFSSGPTKKHPGWRVENLSGAALGRSHRAKIGKAKLQEAIDRTKALCGCPSDYKVAIVPASDTGAIEMCMWSMLGGRPVDVFAWENFGEEWVTDAVEQLKLKDCNTYVTPYGELPPVEKARKEADIVFTQNGTAAGVKIPNWSWIADDRQGITINDATSALFAQPVNWAKSDVTTFSWQKVMGGEAAHGMIILSPRAVARLESYTPSWPVPKIFRMTKKGKLDAELFEGSTINTPSLLATEDYLDALNWADSIGGLSALHARADANAKVLHDWIDRTPWIANLAGVREQWSNTGVCMKIVDPRVLGLPADKQAAFAKDLAALLEKEGVALDAAAYRTAPPGLRVWCGGTVEKSDLEALTLWIDWAFDTLIADVAKAA